MSRAAYLGHVVVLLVLLSLASVAPAYSQSSCPPPGWCSWQTSAGKVGTHIYFLGGAVACPGWVWPGPHYVEWCEPTVIFGSALNNGAQHEGCNYTATGSATLGVGDNPFEIGRMIDWCGITEDARSTIHITGIALTGISGQHTVHVGEQATYTPITNPEPEHNGPWACFLVRQDDGSADKCGDWDDPPPDYWCYSQTDPYGRRGHIWNKPGIRIVRFKCGTSSRMIPVRVLPPFDQDGENAPPGTCPADTGTTETNGCSTCTQSDSFPTPDPRTGQMQFPASRVPAAPPDVDPWGDAATGRSPGSIQITTSTSGTRMAIQTAAAFFSEATSTENGHEWHLDDGSVLTQSGTNPGEAGYTLASPDGSTRVFVATPQDQRDNGDSVLTPLLSSVTDPDGRTTTYYRDTAGVAIGALNQVHLPNDDVWTYQHEFGDRRITKATAPDNTTTKYDYDAETGRVSRIRVYPTDSCGQGTELSDMQIVYTDSAGECDYQARPLSASKSNLETVYTYDGDDVTVTVRNKNQPSEVFSQTVYAYDTAGTTTITRKHPTNSAYDQTTTYEYYMKQVGSSTYRTWLYKVTDSEENSTTYSRYVGYDTVTAGKECTETDNKFLLGKVYKMTDDLDRETIYDYNPDGSLASVTHPDDSTEEYVYYTDSAGNNPQLKTVKNVRGNYTHYDRDPNAMHRVTEVRVSAPVGDPLREPTETEWNAITALRGFSYYTSGADNGLLYTETVPDIDDTEDCVKTYVYTDSAGKVQPGPTQSTYRFWNGSSYDTKTSTTEYDVSGRALKTTDANSRSMWYTYDDLGRPLKTIYAVDTAGNPSVYTQNTYDCCNLLVSRDEDGRETHYVYDQASRVTKVYTNVTGQSEGNPLVMYEYDGFGNIASVTTFSDSSTGRTTAYVYDANNRVIQIDHPTGLGSEYFQYDEVGNLEAKQDGNDDVTAYEYDSLNRLVAVKYGYGSNAWPAVITGSLSNPDVTYSYCGGSRLRHEMTDSVGTSHYDYDIQDRLTSYTPPAPADRLVEYEYNALGEKTSITNGSMVVNYGYYANGWLKGVKRGTSPVADYTYDQVGNRTRVDLGNTTYTTYGYDSDPRYRVNDVEHYKEGDPDVLLKQIAYPIRDSAGNPRRMVVGTTQTDYDYDANSRLTVENSTSFGYDWVGNRNPSACTYNAADELTARASHVYEYTATGSLLYQEDESTIIQKRYEYTPANLLGSVTHVDVSGVPVSSMTWDADGNRVSFTSSTGGTWQFVYDTTAGIPAVIDETGPVYYIREPSGALIARIDGETVNYYHFDALGSTRLLTDADGEVTDAYTYDAWGNATHDSGSTAQPYQFVGQLGYYTHVQDANFPLLQLGVRFYDTQLGRFTSRDPVRHGRNWYLYVNDRPVSAMDPTGLFCWHIGGGCFGTTCHDDVKCPPTKPRKPKKPWAPPPQVTTPPTYVLPPAAGEGATLCDPDAACGAMAAFVRNALLQLEMDHDAERISDEEYERRKAELERLLEGCAKYADDNIR